MVELFEEIDFAPKGYIGKFLEDLNPYYIPTRYPEAVFKLKVIYGRRTAQNILKQTQEVFKWLKIELYRSK